jgi:hypothetical protein
MKREQSRKRVWLMGSAWVGLSLAVILFSLLRLPRLIARAPAQDAGGSSRPLQVVYLTPNPSPDELAAAKQALAKGEIVFTEGGSLDSFDGLLGVGIPDSSATEHNLVFNIPGPTEKLQFKAVAARIAPNGALHDFVYYAGSAACNSQAALDAWENQQDQQDQEAQNGDNPMPNGDTPVPQAYTQLTETTYGWCHAVGNYMQDRSQLYRLNESNKDWDWYLTFKQSWATQPNFIKCHGPADCGWLNDNRKYELSTEPRFTLAEHNPKNVSGSVTYTLGANVREGPQFTVSWDQPDVKTTDKSSLPQDTAEWGDHFAPYTGGSPKDTAKNLFVSKPESIFQVPQGTDSFFLHVYDNARWYWAQLGDPKIWIDSSSASMSSLPSSA